MAVTKETIIPGKPKFVQIHNSPPPDYGEAPNNMTDDTQDSHSSYSDDAAAKRERSLNYKQQTPWILANGGARLHTRSSSFQPRSLARWLRDSFGKEKHHNTNCVKSFQAAQALTEAWDEFEDLEDSMRGVETLLMSTLREQSRLATLSPPVASIVPLGLRKYLTEAYAPDSLGSDGMSLDTMERYTLRRVFELLNTLDVNEWFAFKRELGDRMDESLISTIRKIRAKKTR